MKYFIIIFSCILLLGCSNSNNQEFSYQKITSEEALEIMKERENYLVLDVRNRAEFTEEHIEGAFNLPYNEINELIDIDKDTVIFVYCKSGTRSKIAAEKLIELGYEVYDLGAYENIDLEE